MCHVFCEKGEEVYVVIVGVISFIQCGLGGSERNGSGSIRLMSGKLGGGAVATTADKTMIAVASAK